MTTESVFILFKKTNFNTILACLGGKVYRWWGGRRIFVAEIGGRKFIDANFFVNLGPPHSEENDRPLMCHCMRCFWDVSGENIIIRSNKQ